jgi:hypothetical protein
MPQIERSEKKEGIKISKLHFLIHPGFNTDPHELKMFDYFQREREIFQNQFVLERYIGEAKKMEPDEIMIAFLHTKGEDLKSDLKENVLYAKTIKELKNILGGRLVVISDKFNVNNDPKAYEAAKKVMEARGYVFDGDVYLKAYGECFGACVQRGSQNLRESGGFSKKVEIDRELTDGALNKRKMPRDVQ